LHKLAIRIITHSNIRTHTKPLFSKLQLLKLHDMYELEIAKLMLIMINNYIDHLQFQSSYTQTIRKITSSKIPNLYWAKILK